MSTWQALVCEIDNVDAVWHADVTADSEGEALRAALEIFLNTEDAKGVALDYTTLTVDRKILLKPLEICEAASG